ncbi:unnamed protein product [Vitrella brassicaformis CCMP3155]|uniref:3'-5' exonuclease domain-containing protein n=3 Tax=Vitrella brassicaformis TaxID=1169539 RepID=A0A0G4EKK3_VITBC|nr:unnamed protein product [Vitrella brassicaformis CCMP3155]|eukprot:CEL97651.1 unnamed protein product [Vitrella brassicaformis CCMP3155]
MAAASEAPSASSAPADAASDDSPRLDINVVISCIESHWSTAPQTVAQSLAEWHTVMRPKRSYDKQRRQIKDLLVRLVTSQRASDGAGSPEALVVCVLEHLQKAQGGFKSVQALLLGALVDTRSHGDGSDGAQARGGGASIDGRKALSLLETVEVDLLPLFVKAMELDAPPCKSLVRDHFSRALKSRKHKTVFRLLVAFRPLEAAPDAPAPSPPPSQHQRSPSPVLPHPETLPEHDLRGLIESLDAPSARQLFEHNPRALARAWSTPKHSKLAVGLVKQNGWPISDFPELNMVLFSKTLRYAIFSEGMTSAEILRFVDGDPHALMALCQETLRICPYTAVKCAEALTQYQETHPLPPSLRQDVNRLISQHNGRPFAPRLNTRPRDHRRRSSGPAEVLALADLGIAMPGAAGAGGAGEVVLVNDPMQLTEVLERLKQEPFVGVDGEWRPVLSAFQQQKCALLQIAAGRMVYLVDLHAMGAAADEPVSQFMSDPTPIKIGFMFHQEDVKALRARGAAYNKTITCMDVGNIARALHFVKDPPKPPKDETDENGQPKEKPQWPPAGWHPLGDAARSPPPFSCSLPPPPRGSSLSSLCHLLLGKPLSKTSQFCNWEYRPLDDAQVAYAALDAAAIPRLIERMAADLQVSTTEMLAMAHTRHQKRRDDDREPDEDDRPGPSNRGRGEQQPRPEKRAKRQEGKKQGGAGGAVDGAKERSSKQLPFRDISASDLKTAQQQWAKYRTLNGIEEWRFVLPVQCQKLCRKLRGMGVDSLLRTDSHRDGMMSVAHSDERVILTKESGKNGLYKNMPVYYLQSDLIDAQLREVLQVFGIEFGDDDICSRCAHCNACEWQEAAREEVQDMVSPAAYEQNETFWRCGGCQRLYWEGPLWHKARAHFQSFREELKSPDTDG